MRNTPLLTTICLTILFSINSCKSSKESTAQRKADIMQSKESTVTCFTQLKDGTIKCHTSLKLVTGFLKAPYLLANGNTKIAAKEIKAYQNNEHYAISQSGFTTGRRSYIATETLPGFALRIAKGTVNVYTKKYFNGTSAVDEYFVQKGDDGLILAYTAETMNLLVKDDPAALDFFLSKKYNTPKSKKDPGNLAYVKNDKKLVTKNK